MEATKMYIHAGVNLSNRFVKTCFKNKAFMKTLFLKKFYI